MVIESASTRSPRRKHDLAYACFLPPVIVSLIAAAGTVIPTNTGVAGGIGFLILIPLTLLALVSMVAKIVTEAGSVAFYNATAWVYAGLGTILEASWFLVRRWRALAP